MIRMQDKILAKLEELTKDCDRELVYEPSAMNAGRLFVQKARTFVTDLVFSYSFQTDYVTFERWTGKKPVGGLWMIDYNDADKLFAFFKEFVRLIKEGD